MRTTILIIFFSSVSSFSFFQTLNSNPEILKNFISSRNSLLGWEKETEKSNTSEISNPTPKEIKHPPDDGIETNNPLWERFQNLSRSQSINLNYTKRVQIHFDDFISFRSGFFCHKPQSLDVIVFGDSTMAWGIVPNVIEEKTGLKVGNFSMRGVYLNKIAASTIQKLQKIYLKKDGTLILGFSFDHQNKPGDIVHRRDDDFGLVHDLDIKEIYDFALTRYKDCHSLKELPPDYPSFEDITQKNKPKLEEDKSIISLWKSKKIFSEESLMEYNRIIVSIKKTLQKRYGLELYKNSFLKRKYDEVFLVDWMKEKDNVDKNIEEDSNRPVSLNESKIYKLDFSGKRENIQSHALIKWDWRSTTLFQKYGIYNSFANQAKPYPNWKPPYHLEKNAKYIAQIPGNVAYTITYHKTESEYRILRSIYDTFYKDRFMVIDLGLRHPDKPVPIDRTFHTINEGGIIKSVQIAEWINENFPKNTRQNIRPL